MLTINLNFLSSQNVANIIYFHSEISKKLNRHPEFKSEKRINQNVIKSDVMSIFP